MSSLQIGKAIYTILAKNNISKVFPLVADEGTTFPFIVYKRSGLELANTKDVYNFSELATLDIIVAANTYEESISRGTYADITIEEITLDDADEDYLEDTFIQKLTFKINIK